MAGGHYLYATLYLAVTCLTPVLPMSTYVDFWEMTSGGFPLV